jgi:hypothetical protein
MDELNTEKVQIKPIDIENPSLPFQARHIMPDVHVRAVGVPRSELLVWFNGVFVPTLEVSGYDDAFYIPKGMTLVQTTKKYQPADVQIKYRPSGHITTCTVFEDEKTQVNRFKYNMRLFRWDNVIVHPWEQPIGYESVPISYEYSAVYIPNAVLFPVEVNKNAHIIVENGVIVDPDDYYVDPNNPKKIFLKRVEIRAQNLLDEVIKDKVNFPEYYINMKPLDTVKSALLEKTYYLVNFASKDASKELFIKHSRANAVDHPYRNEVTFGEVALGDMVLLNGVYVPYEWIHKSTVSYPDFAYTYDKPSLKLKEEDVSRLYFVTKSR